MNRRDAHLDTMLRHLGAAYYDSLHGRADNAAVRRAVAQVASQMDEKPEDTGTAPSPGRAAAARMHHGRYHSRVRDVMTTSVVSVDRITPYKEIASLLARHNIGGVPVLKLGRHVAGIVTDADLVAASGRTHKTGARSWLSRRPARQQRLTAEQLMASPAITTHPDAPLASAARTMTERRIRQLPVVDANGVLVGIISRRDLLKVFLRPDADISRQARELLADVLPASSDAVTATVQDGVVTLTGLAAAADRDQLQHTVAVLLDLDGVVDVIDQTGTSAVV
jgi:CBS domain-containing protein